MIYNYSSEVGMIKLIYILMKIHIFSPLQVALKYNSQEQVDKNKKGAKSGYNEDDDCQRTAWLEKSSHFIWRKNPVLVVFEIHHKYL